MRAIKSSLKRSNPSTRDGKKTLESLALPFFAPLSIAETALLNTSTANFAPDAAETLPPETQSGAVSAASHVVRAKIIRWLLTSDAAVSVLDRKGIFVDGVTIIGTLDLESITSAFSLNIRNSEISELRLDHSSFPQLRVIDSKVGTLSGVLLRLKGSLLLMGLHTSGPVKLHGATIEGTLNLDRARLSCPDGCSLNLEGARIGQSVLMRNDFRSDGNIRLYATHIANNLECSGTIIASSKSNSLLIESTKIGGSLLLRNGFRSLGTLRIFETVVVNSVDFQASRLSARGELALLIHGCQISGSLLLGRRNAKIRSRFRGGLSFARTEIGGDLDFSNTNIISRRMQAVSIPDIRIDGSLVAEGSLFRGQVVMDRASVGANTIFSSSQMLNKNSRAFGARGFHCKGSLILGNKFIVDGSFELYGVSIGDELHAIGATFTNQGGLALNLAEATINKSVLLAGCTINGSVSLFGAKVGATVDLSNGNFDGKVGLARSDIGGHLILNGSKLNENSPLVGDSLRCNGAVIISEGFEAHAGANFSASIIQGGFLSPKSTYGNGSATSLVLARARIEGDLVLWNCKFSGTVSLEQASIRGHVIFSGSSIRAREPAVRPYSSLDASGCSVGGDAIFDEGFRARGMVMLNRARITGSLILKNCFISSRGQTAAVSLIGATISDDIEASVEMSLASRFSGLCLLGSLDLRKATVDGSVDLSGMRILNGRRNGLCGERLKVKGALDLRSEFRSNATIDLRHAVVGSYLDSDEAQTTPNQFMLDGFVYSTIFPSDASTRTRWLALNHVSTKDGMPISLQPYEQLVQTLKKQGQEKDARATAIAKQRHISKAGTEQGLAKWMHWVYGATIHYGYRPQRALRFAPAFIFALCIVFYTGADRLMVPSNPIAAEAARLKKDLPYGYPSFNAIAYSLDMFVPILNLQQKDSWRVDDQATCTSGPTNCGFFLRIYMWLHIAAGWIITTFAVAGFTGLVRKD